MTEARQMQDDLRYVRQLVDQRDRQPPPGTTLIYWVWAVYTLIGYTLIDVAPGASGPFFLIGGLVGGVVSGFIGYRARRQLGEWDTRGRWVGVMHWIVGVLLCVAATFALCAVIPPLRQKMYPGQLVVVMIGVVYYLAGVHMDRWFLVLGPVLMIGGVVVGLVPHYGWTMLGAVIALGLIAPTFFRRSRQETPHVAAAA